LLRFARFLESGAAAARQSTNAQSMLNVTLSQGISNREYEHLQVGFRAHWYRNKI